jgi:hypothetical protein
MEHRVGDLVGEGLDLLCFVVANLDANAAQVKAQSPLISPSR